MFGPYFPFFLTKIVKCQKSNVFISFSVKAVAFQKINGLVAEHASQSEALDSFDRRFRSVLPTVVSDSMGRNQLPYIYARDP